MGGLIPTAADQEICRKLNSRFSNAVDPNNPGKTWLQSIRDQNAMEQLFDPNHSLNRLAWRFNAYPAVEVSKLRWFFLLRSQTSPDALSDQNRRDIKQALNEVMNDNTILQVLFSTEHDGTIATRFEVDWVTGDEPDLPNDPSGRTLIKTLSLTLKCQIDRLIPNAPNEHDPPDPDANEQPPPIIR